MPEPYQIIHGDCLDVLRAMPDGSVNLILTDPPYYRVKDSWWDRQWDTPAGFLAWLDSLLAEFARVLAPNGSLYLFASPQMAARVEVTVAERFRVLNSVTWDKGGRSSSGRACKEDLRAFFPESERIIFAEHFDADGSALRGSGYADAAAKLRAGVFEPLRLYLVGERDAAGLTNRAVDHALGTNGMAGHYFGASQWVLPTPEAYAVLRRLANGEHFRREYEDLRREYEDLRRPFEVSASVPYTDVWKFPTVAFYAGKHECEKPREMIAHAIRASSRPGDVVADFFAGSGVVGEMAVHLGRRFVGCEIDETWHRRALARIASADALPLFADAPSPAARGPMVAPLLFDAPETALALA